MLGELAQPSGGRSADRAGGAVPACVVSLVRVYFFQRRRRRIKFCLPTVTSKTFVFICREKMITFTLHPHVHTMCGNLALAGCDIPCDTQRRSDLSRLLRKNSIINAAAGRIGILHLSGRTSYLPATGCDVLGGCADATLRCHFGATHDGGG